ncbi:MAG TPA: carbohydrate binding family 9 domain-containing protein [Thermoanaerobaculia bacterium]
MAATGEWLLATSLLALPEAQRPSLAPLATDRDLSAADFDDLLWDKAPAARGLFQQEPDEGAPATLATECRVIATPKALLLRFVMAEPAAELVARELRRDADLSNDDRVAFVLDTYRDRRNAYFFATNPNGAREDGLVTEEGDPSLDWDTVWDVRVRRTPDGWDALFRIPYTALNFPGGQSETWGFNFSRIMRRRTETVRWTGWKRPFALSKISLAGDLTGLPALPARRLRSLTPYALGAVEKLESPPDTNLLGRAGFDFRYGVSSSTEADLTVNTDFAETETDAQQFNFGRTSLFFPEKRLFFLQRSQTFDFGSEHTTFPFFSRTIGLKSLDDTSVPIHLNAGIKLTGRLGPTDFGALAVQTRPAEGEPRTNFFAGRTKVDLGHASYVGGLFTDIERITDDPSRKFSRTYGADTLLNFTPEWSANGFYVGTSNPGISGETKAWKAELNYHGEYANAQLHRSNIGSAYDPQMGFVSQNGIHQNFVDLELTPRPRALDLKNLSFETFYLVKYNENGTLNEREYQYTFRANWLSGAYTDEDIVDVFDENLTEPLELTDTVTIPSGAYHFTRHQVSFGTDPSRVFAIQTRVNFGQYYGGKRDAYTGRLFVKPAEHVSVSLIEDYNVVRLPQGDFNLSLFSGRVDWNPSVRLLSSVIVQSDNVVHLTNVQAIVRWLIDPATDLFAVYNRQIGRGFERPGTRVTLKFRRTFDL